MSKPIDPSEAIRIKRRLRMKIGRMRRRINDRLQGSRREASRLVNWQTYVKRYPAGSLAAAFGVGLAASTGLKRPRLLASIFGLIASRGAAMAAAGAKNELLRIWEESTPRMNFAQGGQDLAGGEREPQ